MVDAASYRTASGRLSDTIRCTFVPCFTRLKEVVGKLENYKKAGWIAKATYLKNSVPAVARKEKHGTCRDLAHERNVLGVVLNSL